MLCLGLDTASSRGSVALVDDGAVLANASLDPRGRPSCNLLEQIDLLLNGVHRTVHDLGGIGVALGPGSFTGVRIGMATAKGMAYALQIGLVGLSTLEAMARVVSHGDAPQGTLCSVMQAGRGEVYAAWFAMTHGEVVRLDADRSWTPGDLAEALPEGTSAAGDGAELLQQAARAAGRPLLLVDALPPLAPGLARWAGRSVVRGSGYQPGGLGPNYVRPSYAQKTRQPR